MVALSSSRRQSLTTFRTRPLASDAFPAHLSGAASIGLEGQASRRAGCDVEVIRDRRGAIEQVRIGRWRTLAAAPQRRLAEVRGLSGDRVAVKIERLADGGSHPTSEIWQLYDREGRQLASMQTAADGRFAMLTNYQTRQACRLVRNARNEMETAETWAI